MLPAEIETERLRLRQPIAADAETIFRAYAQDPDGKDLSDVPSMKLNGGLMYFVNTRVFKLHMATVVRWVKDYREGVLGKNMTYPGNTNWDFNFVLPLGKHAELNLQIRNILDSRNKFPKNGLAEVPMPGATVYGGITTTL